MPDFAFADRRNKTRYPSDGLMVYVRRKGRLGRLEGLAQDFNRHGLAVVLDQPLQKETMVYLNLCSGETKLEQIIGVVHNCIGQDGGYRCGIQFRTSSVLQFDQAMVEQELSILEARFRAHIHPPAYTEVHPEIQG